MATKTFTKTSNAVLRLDLTGTDFNLAAANTTTQSFPVGRLPSYASVDFVHVVNTGSTVTGGSVSALNASVGNTSGGNQFVTNTDVHTTLSAASMNGGHTTVVSVTEGTVWVNFTPVGGNWNAVTTAAASIGLSVFVVFNDITGEVLR